MSGTHLRAPHRTTGAVWRAWLARRLGWRALRGLPEPLAVDGRELSLLPLASAGEVVALLCEPVMGGPLPDYAARRRIRGAIEAAHARPLTLFVDGANLERVWSWVQEESGGVMAYREAEGSGAEAESPVAAPELAAAAARGRCSTAPAPDPVAGAALHRLTRALGLQVEPAADLPQRIQSAVEGSSAPGPLRAAWRALLGTRVVDPACGAGDRLLLAARLLEPPYLACLERMRVWVCETGRERPAPRRDRLADFRRLVGRAGPPGDRRRWVRELILYHNLSGADPDAAAVATCRRRLLDHLRAGAPAGEPAPEGAVFNVRAGDLARGIATRRALERRLSAVVPAQAASLLEEVDTAARARRVILRLHLEGAVDAAGLEAGARSVHRWLDRVAPALDHLLPVGPPGAARPLHGVLEHAGAETLTVLAGPRA